MLSQFITRKKSDNVSYARVSGFEDERSVISGADEEPAWRPTGGNSSYTRSVISGSRYTSRRLVGADDVKPIDAYRSNGLFIFNTLIFILGTIMFIFAVVWSIVHFNTQTVSMFVDIPMHLPAYAINTEKVRIEAPHPFYIGWALAAVFIIQALFHTTCALNSLAVRFSRSGKDVPRLLSFFYRTRYYQMISTNLHPQRWLEYSFTMSITTMVVAGVVGMNNFDLLVPLILISFFHYAFLNHAEYNNFYRHMNYTLNGNYSNVLRMNKYMQMKSYIFILFSHLGIWLPIFVTLSTHAPASVYAVVITGFVLTTLLALPTLLRLLVEWNPKGQKVMSEAETNESAWVYLEYYYGIISFLYPLLVFLFTASYGYSDPNIVDYVHGFKALF